MRLIDLDSALLAIRNIHHMPLLVKDWNENDELFFAIWSLLSNAPLVKAVPVVESEWKTIEKTQKDGLMYFVHTCPMCHNSHSDLRRESQYGWCPHCGAKMNRRQE